MKLRTKIWFVISGFLWGPHRTYVAVLMRMDDIRRRGEIREMADAEISGAILLDRLWDEMGPDEHEWVAMVCLKKGLRMPDRHSDVILEVTPPRK